MRKIRLGFVGVGRMGQAAHLRNYATLPQCELAAVAEPRPRLREAVAARYGIPEIYASHYELVAKADVDAIVAVQPFEAHCSLVPEVLKKGVPVMIEKPLASSSVEGRAVLTAAEKSGVPLYLAYHKRSDPACTYAKAKVTEWQRSGVAGRLKYIRIAMPPGDWTWNGFDTNIETEESYEVPPGNGGRYIAFVNYYVHQINLFRFFLEEDYEIVFADPSGVTLAIRSASDIPGTLEMAAFQSTLDWQESVYIAFEKGWVSVNIPAPMTLHQPGSVTVFSDFDGQPSRVSPVLPHRHAMLAQAENFLRAVKGEPQPLCQASEGLKDLINADQYIALLAAQGIC